MSTNNRKGETMRTMKTAVAIWGVAFVLGGGVIAQADDPKMVPGTICQPSYFGVSPSGISVSANGVINYSGNTVQISCPLVRDNTGTLVVLRRLEVMAFPSTTCQLCTTGQSSAASSSCYFAKSVSASRPFGAYKLTWLESEMPSNLPKHALTVDCTLAPHPNGDGWAGGGVVNIFYVEP
jgi:hypothetical protein